jgi:hypothetical protein
MAQGLGKALGKAKKKASGGAKKRKVVNAKKHSKRKGSAAIENNKGIIAATKAINRKNERIIAAKATNAGTRFCLTDISTKGKQESQRQTAIRDKKQSKNSTSVSDRLKDQIKKLK